MHSQQLGCSRTMGLTINTRCDNEKTAKKNRKKPTLKFEEKRRTNGFEPPPHTRQQTYLAYDACKSFTAKNQELRPVSLATNYRRAWQLLRA